MCFFIGCCMYRKQLKRQLDFLSRSCEIFDHGNQNEAIRIAVALRTLFRDTNKSTSLMRLLGQQDSIKLLSTLETNDDPRLIHIDGNDFIPLMLTSDGQRPHLYTSRKKEEVFLCDWLSEVVLVLEGENFTRENIIVTAANKDGGTHVPKKLNRKAKLLKKSFGQYTVYENKRAITNELNNHHFIILRQLAYEVLNSKPLYELNDIEFCQPKEVKSYREYLIEADNYHKQKRFFKAIESYRKAIKTRPEASEIAYNNMGNCYTELEEFNDAKMAYSRAINLNSEYVDPLFNLSRLYYREKRYDLAMSTYDQILQLDSKHKQATHNYHVLFNYLTLEKEVEYQYQNVLKKAQISIIFIAYAMA